MERLCGRRAHYETRIPLQVATSIEGKPVRVPFQKSVKLGSQRGLGYGASVLPRSNPSPIRERKQLRKRRE